ncbi:hypothetical protein [Natronomonas sp.]|uniref:hypothetical protein n=1 Tax=Natronomonas sp. TaxID=2184060 RepID=UPI002FC2ABB5
MASDLGNMLRMVGLLGDDEFVDALTDVETLVNDVQETLDRVEEVEREAGQAVDDANESLANVDQRLERFDEMISRLEAKIEAGFSIGFFVFALNRWSAGDPYLAAGLFVMGLLGASSLVVTIYRMPQVRKLRKLGRYASSRIDE